MPRTNISEHFGQVTENWAVPAEKYGWSLRLKLKKRTILHLGPRSKHFIAAIILGEKAVAALRDSDLAPEVITMVEHATRYLEGRVIRFEIGSKKETEVVEALAKIKMDNRASEVGSRQLSGFEAMFDVLPDPARSCLAVLAEDPERPAALGV